MVTKVGDGMFADNTVQNFHKYKSDTAFMEKVPHTSSRVALIFLDPSSENRISIIKEANQYLLPEDIDRAAEKLRECSLFILQLEVNLAAAYHAIAFGNKHGIPALLNPVPASKELDFLMACKCDFFMSNETELEILTGMPVNTEAEIQKAAMTLVEKGGSMLPFVC